MKRRLFIFIAMLAFYPLITNQGAGGCGGSIRSGVEEAPVEKNVDISAAAPGAQISAEETPGETPPAEEVGTPDKGTGVDRMFCGGQPPPTIPDCAKITPVGEEIGLQTRAMFISDAASFNFAKIDEMGWKDKVNEVLDPKLLMSASYPAFRDQLLSVCSVCARRGDVLGQPPTATTASGEVIAAAKSIQLTGDAATSGSQSNPCDEYAMVYSFKEGSGKNALAAVIPAGSVPDKDGLYALANGKDKAWLYKDSVFIGTDGLVKAGMKKTAAPKEALLGDMSQLMPASTVIYVMNTAIKEGLKSPLIDMFKTTFSTIAGIVSDDSASFSGAVVMGEAVKLGVIVRYKEAGKDAELKSGIDMSYDALSKLMSAQKTMSLQGAHNLNMQDSSGQLTDVPLNQAPATGMHNLNMRDSSGQITDVPLNRMPATSGAQ